jgi:hypothetical protein
MGPLSALVVRLKCSLHRSPFTHNIVGRPGNAPSARRPPFRTSMYTSIS